MKKRIFFVVVLLFFANSFCEMPAQTAFEFINLPVSARAAGGSVSLIGDKDNVMAMRSNPAMIAGMNKNAVEIGFSPVITGMDIYSGVISSAIILKNGLVISPSLTYLSFGSIDAVDENGDDMQTQVSPFALSIETAMSYKFYEKLSFGARLKFMHERITQKTIYWNENAYSALAADLGIFSQHRIFRYSAGFRNLGFVLEKDAYMLFFPSVGASLAASTPDNVKVPSSAFAAVGVVVDGEAKLGWFLECEKYFYDYMFFRTGFEIPTPREILIFRTGTSFTPEDIQHAFGNLSGERKQAWEYSSGTWTLVSVGGTINARIDKNLLSIDIACQFRKDGMRPGLLFSGTMYF